MKYVDVKDPQGLTHRVGIEGGRLYGYENLAHGFERSVGRQVIEDVITVVGASSFAGENTEARERYPLPHGFTYAR